MVTTNFSGDETNTLVWQPTEEQKKASNINRFMEKHQISSLEDFLQKASNDPDWFYPAILQELQMKWHQEYERVVDLSNGIELPTWFPGGLTNVYTYGLEKHIELGRGNELALIWEGEDGSSKAVTFNELKEKTDRLASGLTNLGIKKGDRIGILLPQISEIQPILFACAKIGAVVIPCFSGFGVEAIALRLNDGGAKLLFTADGFYRRGKIIELKKIALETAKLVPSLEHLVMINRIEAENDNTQQKQIHGGNLAEIPYDSLIESTAEVPAVSMRSDEPYLIIYTSGTTGKPKGTFHTHYSFPLKNAIDMYFSFDVKPNDRMFWLTDLGWMMGPWLIFGTAILGATAVIYEGSPDYPNVKRLWQLAEKHQVTIFGVAPTVIRSLMKHDQHPVQEYDLSRLKVLGSTGEAWNPKPWLWFFEEVGGKRCPIINYSGGTEISGGILGCLPILPQKPCSFHGPLPGMSATVVDENGNPVVEDVGDLVITKPFLGMTYSFWNDHKRYLQTYWNSWEGLWHHGDFAKVDKDGFWFILGRSDDTMNIAGKRVGPADLESAITSHENVKEAVAISIPDEVKGEVPVLFVVTNEGVSDKEELTKEFQSLIASKVGKSFLPKAILFIDNLPKTQSGKIARRIVRSAYLGQSVGDISTLQNPEIINTIQAAHKSST